MTIIAQCPECGGGDVVTTKLLAVIGRTPDGKEVLQEQDVFACSTCEWVREVKAELWRRRQNAFAAR